MNDAALPRHDEIGGLQRAIELASVVAAGSMLVWQGSRLALSVGVGDLWLVLVAASGLISADLVSGIVHWAADTWGSETLPILGRRLLRPFRVHHVNPADFIRRDFIDTNGDVSLLVLLPLILASVLPVDGVAAQAGIVALVSFAAAGWLTNQVHQWAHVERPPRLVAWLQRRDLLLSPAAHARHHLAPYASNYCIATGWLNGPLAAVSFFPRMEWLVARCTGLRPRGDDEAFAARVVP